MVDFLLCFTSVGRVRDCFFAASWGTERYINIKAFLIFHGIVGDVNDWIKEIVCIACIVFVAWFWVLCFASG